MNEHSDTGEINQEETVIQHYWTIVTNVQGDLLTAVECNMDVELRPFVDPAGNSIPIHPRSEEHEAYSYYYDSDPIENETSFSESTKSEGYINPINSNHTRNIEDCDVRLSHSMECNAYIHPVPSDPMEPDAYTESTHLGYKSDIESIHDSISSHPGPHNQYTPSDCVYKMQSDTNIDDVETEHVYTARHVDTIPSD
ncbi:hypothetical protein ACJMK2_026012 [Sinanodonta woodiana]|uniref:Uncharacterized protein n=1 Tax=Sinanodonta woodiana TaxID=1069815 RepID=A0ABD3XI79_SINWO